MTNINNQSHCLDKRQGPVFFNFFALSETASLLTVLSRSHVWRFSIIHQDTVSPLSPLATIFHLKPPSALPTFSIISAVSESALSCPVFCSSMRISQHLQVCADCSPCSQSVSEWQVLSGRAESWWWWPQVSSVLSWLSAWSVVSLGSPHSHLQMAPLSHSSHQQQSDIGSLISLLSVLEQN